MSSLGGLARPGSGGMMTGRGVTRAGSASVSKTEALLQKAAAQLKGERLKSDQGDNSEEAELEAYLSTLEKQQPTVEPQWDKFDDPDELQAPVISQQPLKSEGAGGGGSGVGSMFLKKKSKVAPSGDASSVGGGDVGNKRSHIDIKSTEQDRGNPAAKTVKTTASSAAIMNWKEVVMADSDGDIDVSLDEQVLDDVRRMKGSSAPLVSTSVLKSVVGTQPQSSGQPRNNLVKPFDPTSRSRTTTSAPAVRRVGSPAQAAPARGVIATAAQVRGVAAVMSDDDSGSSPRQIGKGGSQFLKKPTTVAAQQSTTNEIPEVREKKKTKDKKGQASASEPVVILRPDSSDAGGRRRPSRPILDTDEDESLAEYIGGLSSSSSLATVDRKSPRKGGSGSARTPRSKTTTTNNKTVKNNKPEPVHYNESVSEAESDNFKFNIKEIDTLSDDTPQANKKPSHIHPTNKASHPSSAHPSSSSSHLRGAPSKNSKASGSSTGGGRRDSDPPRRGSAGSVGAGRRASGGGGGGVLGRFGVHELHELPPGGSSEDELEELILPDDVLAESGGRSGAGGSSARGGGVISPMPILRSILSPTPRSMTPRSSRSRVRLMDELIEVRSRSPSPEPIRKTTRRSSAGRSHGQTDPVHSHQSSIHTEPAAGDTDLSTVQTMNDSDTDVPSTIRSEGESSEGSDGTYDGRRRRSSGGTSSRASSSRRSSTISEAYYSDDFTGEESGRRGSGGGEDSMSQTSGGRGSMSDDDDDRSELSWSTSASRSSRTNRHRPRRPHTRDTEVQTGLDVGSGGLRYHWTSPVEQEVLAGQQYGLAFVNPASIATTVVSADALEAMTAYSPAALALNDMLRVQLDLTRQFITTQKRLHFELVRSLDTAGFYGGYTTLAETQDYIRKHRKPVVTFEETLKQVKEEMGLV